MFLAAARALGLPTESHVHPAARGAEGEELAVDVALLGSERAASLLCLLSGTHGVEGFCGSGVQVALLRDPALLAAVQASGVAVLFCHAINPYGFSHLRRTNEDNVDMNRNFRDFAVSRAPNDAYAEVHDFIVPRTWPPAAEDDARLKSFVAARGVLALQAAVTGGQCDHADGLFYGGVRPAWSNDVLRALLRKHGRERRRLLWIDVHSGLGPYGHGEKILSGPDDAQMMARARAVWGADVTSLHDGTSTATPLTGVNFEAPLSECRGVEFTGIGLEFGTVPLLEVLQALRADQWLANHPDAPDARRREIKRQLRDAFYRDTDDWKAMVYGQARAAAMQALCGLSDRSRA